MSDDGHEFISHAAGRYPRSCLRCSRPPEHEIHQVLAPAPSPMTFETHSGRYFDFADPRPEQIHLSDIARALSQTCRFAGHTLKFHSVAEHAVLVASLVVQEGLPELALAALHHDSHEAYLGDWPTPLKNAVGATFLQELQQQTDVAIAKHFGFPVGLFEHPAVKEADLEALYREAATLKTSMGTGPHWGREQPAERLENAGLSPIRAEELFIRTHAEYLSASC